MAESQTTGGDLSVTQPKLDETLVELIANYFACHGGVARGLLIRLRAEGFYVVDRQGPAAMGDSSNVVDTTKSPDWLNSNLRMIRDAIDRLILGTEPASETVIVDDEVRNVSEFEGAVMVTSDGSIYHMVNTRWEKVSEASVRSNT